MGVGRSRCKSLESVGVGGARKNRWGMWESAGVRETVGVVGVGGSRWELGRLHGDPSGSVGSAGVVGVVESLKSVGMVAVSGSR